MLERVRADLRYPGAFGTLLQHAKELRPVNPPALLRREQIRTVIVTLGEPKRHGLPFIEQRLTLQLFERLNRFERAFQPVNMNRSGFQIHVRQFQIADFGRP